MTGSRRWTLTQQAASRVLARTFPFFERVGVHVTLKHFYGPIPDTRALPSDVFGRETAMIGVHIDDASQLELLKRVERFREEYSSFQTGRPEHPYEYTFQNKSFRHVDAEVLYALVRDLAPSRVIEVGSGQSTYLIAAAMARNRSDGTVGEFTVIDPYPSRTLDDGFPGLDRFDTLPIQTVAPSTFESLRAGDILFIDTSHVLSIGSDVRYEFLEIIPRLSSGVYVHVHDIFLPAEYPREWVMGERLFFNEQYLLQAFLAFNDAFDVVWAGHYMHKRYPDALAAAFPGYSPTDTLPGSFWFRRR